MERVTYYDFGCYIYDGSSSFYGPGVYGMLSMIVRMNGFSHKSPNILVENIYKVK